MAVFIGDTKNSNAAKAGLRIKWAVDNIIKPPIQTKYPSNKYVLRQKVGIAASTVMVARTGIRGSNDLVWVGNSANIAAKLAGLGTNYSTYITEDVYKHLAQWAKNGGNPERNMWTDLGVKTGLGRVYGSTWHWSF
jgi:class 3 adenylate cyclase